MHLETPQPFLWLQIQFPGSASAGLWLSHCAGLCPQPQQQSEALWCWTMAEGLCRGMGQCPPPKPS